MRDSLPITRYILQSRWRKDDETFWADETGSYHDLGCAQAAFADLKRHRDKGCVRIVKQTIFEEHP